MRIIRTTATNESHTSTSSRPSRPAFDHPGFDIESMIDRRMVADAQQLRERAKGLREQAEQLEPLLATSFRRRASELELEGWLLEVRSGLPEALIHTAA
jgi:hypothetical protein